MSAMTDYLEEVIANHIHNKDAYTSPSTYLALYTAAPGETGGGTEVSGGSYARELIYDNLSGSPDWTLAAAADGGYQCSNDDDVTFTQATADWGTITHMAVLDAVSAGNMLLYGALTASKTVNSGDTFKFPAGDLDVTYK